MGVKNPQFCVAYKSKENEERLESAQKLKLFKKTACLEWCHFWTKGLSRQSVFGLTWWTFSQFILQTKIIIKFLGFCLPIFNFSRNVDALLKGL